MGWKNIWTPLGDSLYTVERAFELLDRELGDDQARTQYQLRLDEIDRELENLVRLAAKLGDLDPYQRVVDELRAERSEIQHRIERQQTPILRTREQLRALVTEKVLDLRGAFEGAIDLGRSAFRELLGDRRMRVGPDPDRGFRAEGLFEWPLEMRNARRPQDTGRLVSVVAGEGFEPPTSGL